MGLVCLMRLVCSRDWSSRQGALTGQVIVQVELVDDGHRQGFERHRGRSQRGEQNANNSAHFQVLDLEVISSCQCFSLLVTLVIRTPSYLHGNLGGTCTDSQDDVVVASQAEAKVNRNGLCAPLHYVDVEYLWRVIAQVKGIKAKAAEEGRLDNSEDGAQAANRDL